MSDLTCPWCGHGYDYDGCYSDLDYSNILYDECPKCNKEFKFQVEFYPHHYGEKKIEE